MTSVMFTLLLCIAVLGTIFVGAATADFHKSDAAGQGLAKAFTVFANIALLVVLGILMLVAGARLSLLLYVAVAASQFFAVYVLTELVSDSPYQTVLRILAVLGPFLLEIFIALQFYNKSTSRVTAIGAIVVAIASIALGFPARTDSENRKQAQYEAWRQERQKDRTLAAQAEGLPSDTPLVDFLQYTTEDPIKFSEALRAAIARMTAIPDRQRQAEQALNNGEVRLIPLLDRLELTVTPELCEGARKCLRKQIDEFKPSAAAPTFSSVENRANQFTAPARWLLEGHCDCKPELAAFEQNVRLYPDPYPKKFLVDYLLDLQGKARE